MSDKKVNRNIVIAIIIILFLIVGLVGVVLNYTSIIYSKDSVIQSKSSQIQTLNSTILYLRVDRDLLQTWLDNNITFYRTQISLLNFQKTQLQNQINSLNSQIAELESKNYNLSGQLTAKNNEIISLNNQLSLFKHVLNARETAWRTILTLTGTGFSGTKVTNTFTVNRTVWDTVIWRIKWSFTLPTYGEWIELGNLRFSVFSSNGTLVFFDESGLANGFSKTSYLWYGPDSFYCEMSGTGTQDMTWSLEIQVLTK